MAITHINVPTDIFGDFYTAYENSINEIPISGTFSNGIITLTKEGGGTIDIPIDVGGNRIISGLGQSVSSNCTPVNMSITIAAGSYSINGTVWNYGGGTFTIATTIVNPLDASYERLDVV